MFWIVVHQLFNVNKNWNHKLKVTLRHSIFDYVVINEQFFITVPKLRYKITLRHSIFDQVLINKQFFITVQKIFKKNYSRLFLSTTLSSIRIVIGTNVTVLRWYTFFFLQSEARVAWISSDCFESFSPLSRDVAEGVIMTQSNRIKFRLSKYFSVHQFASPVFFFHNLPALTKFGRCYQLFHLWLSQSSVIDVILKTLYKKSGGTAKPVGFRMSAELKKMATEFTTMYRQNSQTTN